MFLSQHTLCGFNGAAVDDARGAACGFDRARDFDTILPEGVMWKDDSSSLSGMKARPGRTCASTESHSNLPAQYFTIRIS
jgi:hypothetical protein